MRTSPFSFLEPAKPDPIFEINGLANKAGKNAINATVGMFLDEEGNTLVFPSVQRAMEELGPPKNLSYPELRGLADFREAVHKLLLLDEDHVASVATTGGTGAVSFNLRLLKKMNPHTAIVREVPTWANHRALSEEAGVGSEELPYLGGDGHPTLEHVREKTKQGAITILLHGNCQNPTGLDRSLTEWRELARMLASSGSVALLDMAYQGFAAEPQEDTIPLHTLREEGVPTLVAWSASKNHSLYSERTGLAAAIVPDGKTKKLVEDHFATITRRIHSASATYGQQIVALVQKSYAEPWRKDLRGARTLLRGKRHMLAGDLDKECAYPLSGNGMFALLPLTQQEIRSLRDEDVFLTDDGRLNVAGIPLKRIPEFAEKVNRELTQR